MEARSSATPTTWSTPWSPRWTRLRRCARCSRPIKIKASQTSELWSSPAPCAFVFIFRKIELWTARRSQRWRSWCCCRRSSCTWRSKRSVLAETSASLGSKSRSFSSVTTLKTLIVCPSGRTWRRRSSTAAWCRPLKSGSALSLTNLCPLSGSERSCSGYCRRWALNAAFVLQLRL